MSRTPSRVSPFACLLAALLTTSPALARTDLPAGPVAPASSEDDAVLRGMLQNMMQPVLTLAQNWYFRDAVYNRAGAAFDGDTNALLTEVMTDLEQSGVIDTSSPEWQSLSAQVAAFSNVNGEEHHPQIYIPNYGNVVSADSVTVVIVDDDPNVEAVPAYQIDWAGNVTFVGYVDEAYAEWNEVWVLSLNERIAMDPRALALVREFNEAIEASESAAADRSSGEAQAMGFITCNPTGLRNNKGMEYLKNFRIPTREQLRSVESWLSGQVEPRVIVVAKRGMEVGNRYLYKRSRGAILDPNGVPVEVQLTAWDRSLLGDHWVYKWVEIDGGSPRSQHLGLDEPTETLLGVDPTANVHAYFERKYDNMGFARVTFSDSTYTEYDTGWIKFKVCSVGGEGSTGNTNLALAATVAASSTYPGYAPERVNDGNQSTALGGGTSWSNYGYDAGYPPQWIQLDFGVNKTFTRVVVFTSSGYPIRDYDIQTFNPTLGWQTAASINGNTALSVTTTFPARTARLIRIYARSGPTHQPGFTRVNEFEVY